MRKARKVMVVAVAIVGYSLSAGPASAGEVLDQENVSGTSCYNSSPGMAQTFTAGASGQLTRVSLLLGRSAVQPSDPTVQIREGGVTGAVLATTTLSQASIPLTSPLTFSWVDATFTSPAIVTAGNTYALVLLRSSLITTLYWPYTCLFNNTYAGGSSWTCEPGIGLLCVQNEVWTEQTTQDRSFRTYVTSASTTDELLTAVTALGLDPAEAQVLIDLLLRTNEYLVAGEYEDAVDKLYDFIDKVEDYVENGTLSPEYGEGLITLTESLIASLESS